MPAEIIRSPKFTAEQVDRALLEMAVCGGNSDRAAKRLRAEGLSISGRTLRYWRERDYPQRYVEVANTQRARVEDVIVANARESALKAAQLEHAALDQALAQAKTGDLKDPTSAARNAAVTKGINVDTTLKLEGRPTQIVGHKRDIEDIVAEINEMAPGLFKNPGVVNGHAEELHDDPPPELPDAA